MGGFSYSAILDRALAGDNTCAACGGLVPVSSRAVELSQTLHRDGLLERMAPEGVRMILVLGSLEVGCGVAGADAGGRVRVSCPACASADERELASSMIAGELALDAGARV